MPTKNINTNTNINKININIPKPRQPKPKSINQAEKELKDLESKDYQYSRTPNVSLSINPNVYGFNTTPIGAENRVLERPSTPTITIEEQQARQADQQERTRQAQEEMQRQEEISRQNAEIQEQQDELFRRESMNRSGLGSLTQSYFQSRGGNDFQRRLNQELPIAEAYPSEYETENETLASRLRNTPLGKARLAAEQRYLDKLQEEKDAREEQKRKGRKAGGANRPKDEIQKEKQSKEDARQKREEGKQKAREMRAKQEEEDKVKKQKEEISNPEVKQLTKEETKKAKAGLRGQKDL